MFEHQRNACQFMLNNARRLIADLPDDRMTYQPMPGMNPPAWIIGHLTIAADFPLQILGQARRCSDAWHAAFGRGTNSSASDLPCTDKAELLSAFESGYRAALDVASRATPEQAAKPIENAFFKDTPIQTVGDLITHLLGTHLALHLGQLSAWRRAMGYAPMF